MKKQILSILLKYGLGLGIMIFMISSSWHKFNDEDVDVGISSLFQAGFEFRWLPLTLALVICGTGVMLTFFRWFVLVRAQGLPFTPLNALRLGMAGYFWSTFLPGSVTGDIPKAYFLAREHSRRTVAVATVIIDRIIGFCALFWLVAFLGSAFWVSGTLEQLVQDPTGQTILEFIVLGGVGLVVATLVFWIGLGFVSVELADRVATQLENFLLPRHMSTCMPSDVTASGWGRLKRRLRLLRHHLPRIGHSLAELWRSVLMYRTRGKSVLLAMGVAMVAHVGFVFTFYLCSLTLYSAQEIPAVGTHFLIVPVGMTIQAGFPTPGGLGGGEAAFSFLYAQVGAVANHGFMACLMQRVVNWVLAGLAYVAWLLMKPATLQSVAEEKNAKLADAPVPELTTGD